MIFFYLIDLILIARLFTTRIDAKLSKKRLVLKFLLIAIGLAIVKAENVFIYLCIGLVVIVFISFLLEKTRINLSKVRLIEIIEISIFLLIICSPSYNLALNSEYLEIINIFLKQHITFFNTITSFQWTKNVILLMGVLLLINESNSFIRYILDLTGISFYDFLKKNSENEIITEKKKELDDTESNNRSGRLIGDVERLIFFTLIYVDQYSAVGFLIAAKAFARFKELDNKNFAEYVLVGTLISLGTALMISLYIKYIVSCLPF